MYSKGIVITNELRAGFDDFIRRNTMFSNIYLQTSKIRRLRTTKKITIANLAKETGISRTRLNEIETFLVKPENYELEAIAKAFEVPVEQVRENIPNVNQRF
jgi:DNA-binding XRE family transcriptional regulator